MEFYVLVEDGQSQYFRIRDSKVVVGLSPGRSVEALEARAEKIAEPIAETELTACCRYVAADPLPRDPSPGDTLIRGHR
jgi:hypothetical protein